MLGLPTVGLTAVACGEGRPGTDAPSLPLELRINEVVSQNEGVWVDELGHADDYIEVYNASRQPLDLSRVLLRDSSGAHPLPALTVAPGEVQLLWADGVPEEGIAHLPFKLDADGERLSLELQDGTIWDSVEVPALAEHHAWARFPDGNGHFVDCGWASPTSRNGDTCGPQAVPGLPDEAHFAPYAWPEKWPPQPAPIALTELALRPAQFVEIRNTSNDTLDLTNYELRLAPSAAGKPWPTRAEGTAISWPQAALAAGARLVVPVAGGELGAIATDPRFEGVATLWEVASGAAVDRVDFDQWPDQAVLARDDTPAAFFRYCAQATPGAASAECTEVASREPSDHVRALRTPGDFDVLAAMGARAGLAGVEFVVDMEAGDRVLLLNSMNWDLHYLFITETIDGKPHIDRCTSEGYSAFLQGWIDFSVLQYFRVEGRRYLLGNLVHHAGPDLHTVEFADGDVISSEQMERAFYAVLRAVPNPTQWYVRPQNVSQLSRAKELEGRVPLVDTNAPYRNVAFQPLSPALAYGTLRFVPAAELASAALGPHDIVVTDRVPNDLPFVGGLITEAIQTPLSHVNILSRARGTPNMFLRGARNDSKVATLLGKVVRLDVRGADFSLESASAEEAVAFWNTREGSRPRLAPRLDTSVRGPQALADRDTSSLPAVGGKAAQLAELLRVPLCEGTAVPARPFAVPLVHSIEHFAASGAQQRLVVLQADPSFVADRAIRDSGLAQVRQAILDHPVDAELLDAVMSQIASNWPEDRLRFRSSSNTEDLAAFNGAGLYESVAWKPKDGRAGVQDALRTVWSSLWNTRAYDEREAMRVDATTLGMGVLVHPAFFHEAANGVIISRDVRQPVRGDRCYVNAQIGEALVTNPAPGVTSDEFALAADPSFLNIENFSRSSLPGPHPVLQDAEIANLVCSMRSVHDHFRKVLDPENANAWFAMDVEFKIEGPERRLSFKQARPYSFGTSAPTGWCDF